MLGEVPGLGQARIKALLRHFGSVAALSQASAEEMTALPGIGPKLAAAIAQRLADREGSSGREASAGGNASAGREAPAVRESSSGR